MHILILGGTTEASALAALLAKQPQMRATLSLAGRTQSPILPAIPHRIGGFGGVEGLAAWMREHGVTALVDATHPFASVMPFNAEAAARETNIPLLALTRDGWQPEAGGHWQFVGDHGEAIKAIGHAPKNIFLTVGRLEIDAYSIAPEHFYLVRTIEPVEPKPLPNAVWITARAPFTAQDEITLLKEHAIDVVITKDSGGDATRAKLIAARELGLPVILIKRPPKPNVKRVMSAEAAMEWITRVHDATS